MAAFPLDPHLARIIVASKRHNALNEALIIVSALSCMDPRERPAEKIDPADLAHKKFGDPTSDFVWYLNVWKACRTGEDSWLSQSRMRAFCQDNFLSFLRLKEWRDVHGQLASIAKCKKTVGSGSFETIHKSLLTGFIANIAVRNEETKLYTMSHGGAGVVFPGSMLVKKGPQWIMFAEKVETSRLFLRTASVIDPKWICEVAPHLVRKRYSAPYFDEEAGTVRATEHKVVFGLIVSKSNIAYGRVNPKEANELFIRDGLIENKLRTHHGFLAHNWTVREGIAALEAKLRVHDLYAGDAALFTWYSRHIPDVTSIHDLNRIIHANSGDAFLRMTMEDLLTSALPPQAALWPDSISIGAEPFPCTYRCDPSDPLDGLTVHLPEEAREYITVEALSWLIRPQWEQRIEAMFESLPREIRKQLSPCAQSAARCAALLRSDHRHFCVALSQTAREVFGINIQADALVNADIPTFLTVHAVFDDKRPEGKQAILHWRAAIDALGNNDITSWDFGDIPEFLVAVADDSGIPLVRYPALHADGALINLMTFASIEQARCFHGKGVAALLEKELEHELAWLGKNSSIDREDRIKVASLGDPSMLSKKAMHAVVEKYGTISDPLCRSQKRFSAHVAEARQKLSGALRGIIHVIAESGTLCAAIAGRLNALKKACPQPRQLPIVKSLILELHGYIATLASDEADYDYLSNLPRYLKRLDITMQRAMNDPLRYTQRMSEISLYEEQLHLMRMKSFTVRRECRKLIEEYKISLFAQQEVKAAPGTSEKKLREAFDGLYN
jgi:ATP-dependent helicase HrpA